MLARLKQGLLGIIIGTFTVLISTKIISPTLNWAGIPDFPFRDLLGFIALLFVILALTCGLFKFGQSRGYVDANEKFLDD